YRQHGPPTYLNWSLMLLGYNAMFQGQPDAADSYFNEAIDVEVPSRTHSPNRVIEARRTFRNGQHQQAFRILRSHLDDILTTDNIQAGLLVAIEFINMMTAINRQREAADLLRYLETTRLLDNPAWYALVADAIETLASTDQNETNDAPGPTHHQALQNMVVVLDDLISPHPDVG
ncbi:MAG: AfsR/SARP family transcriptional regulator, partial [Acidimicrobiia bacterium]|nr:AfsR/SARP family transcriptional regulator [Acidimicrobiia bacterium]